MTTDNQPTTGSVSPRELWDALSEAEREALKELTDAWNDPTGYGIIIPYDEKERIAFVSLTEKGLADKRISTLEWRATKLGREVLAAGTPGQAGFNHAYSVGQRIKYTGQQTKEIPSGTLGTIERLDLVGGWYDAYFDGIEGARAVSEFSFEAATPTQTAVEEKPATITAREFVEQGYAEKVAKGECIVTDVFPMEVCEVKSIGTLYNSMVAYYKDAPDDPCGINEKTELKVTWLPPTATPQAATAKPDGEGVVAKSHDEIEALKNNWLDDPCWDIEDTKGFEAHYTELRDWRFNLEETGAIKEENRLMTKSVMLGCSVELVGYIEALERRLARLEADNGDK